MLLGWVFEAGEGGIDGRLKLPDENLLVSGIRTPNIGSGFVGKWWCASAA